MQPKHIFAALSKRDAIFMQPDNNDIIDSGMCMDAKRPNQCISNPGVRFEKAALNSPVQQPTQSRYSCLPVGKGCFNLVTSDLDMFRQSTLDSGKSLNVLLVR
jgi:hypothetical protein